MVKAKEAVDSAPSAPTASRKRHTADDSEEYRAAQFQGDSKWQSRRKDCIKTGLPQYEKPKLQKKNGKR